MGWKITPRKGMQAEGHDGDVTTYYFDVSYDGLLNFGETRVTVNFDLRNVTTDGGDVVVMEEVPCTGAFLDESSNGVDTFRDPYAVLDLGNGWIDGNTTLFTVAVNVHGDTNAEMHEIFALDITSATWSQTDGSIPRTEEVDASAYGVIWNDDIDEGVPYSDPFGKVSAWPGIEKLSAAERKAIEDQFNEEAKREKEREAQEKAEEECDWDWGGYEGCEETHEPGEYLVFPEDLKPEGDGKQKSEAPGFKEDGEDALFFETAGQTFEPLLEGEVEAVPEESNVTVPADSFEFI